LPLKESPLGIMYLCHRSFQTSKHFSNSIFGIVFNFFKVVLFISSMVVKWRPFKVLFIFVIRKKSHRAISGEYGGYGTIKLLFLAKNLRTSNEAWVGALSWCKSHELFFQKSRHFFSLLHANSVELVASTSYWPFDPVARIYNALCH